VEIKIEKGMTLQCFDNSGRIVAIQALEMQGKVWSYELPNTGTSTKYNRYYNLYFNFLFNI
jgi:hypothetical protein